jgi:hypothetical protein
LVASALALKTALLEDGALVLLLSRALRQSGELFRAKFMHVYRASNAAQLVRPVRETALTLELENGSRVVSLPGDGDTIVGYSGVNLLVIDEAARVPDELYKMVRPMLAVSGGGLICLSTPYGKRGFFYEQWTGAFPWERVKVTAPQCPRIPREFLEEEQLALGRRWYAQEYDPLEFVDVMDAVFAWEDIQATLSTDVQPWTMPARKP